MPTASVVARTMPPGDKRKEGTARRPAGRDASKQAVAVGVVAGGVCAVQKGGGSDGQGATFFFYGHLPSSGPRRTAVGGPGARARRELGGARTQR
jgi:hypothetical protein